MTMPTPTPEHARNPLAFIADLTIPGAGGPARFGDCMAPFQVETFRALAPSLMAVARGNLPPTPRFWIERSKGSSKDTDAAAALLWLLIFSPRALLIQVAAADADQAGEVRRAILDFTRYNEWLASIIDVERWAVINRRSGSRCEVLAADAATAHGSRPDVVLANELSHITRQDFAETLFDNLTKVPRGLGVVCTNAGSINTWQARWRTIAEESSRWSMQVYSQPAPWQDAQELAEAEKRNPPSRFRRLFWGEWSSGTGDAMPADAIARACCLSGPAWRRGDPAEHSICGIGLDLGLTTHHAAAVVVRGSHQKRTVEVAAVLDFPPPVLLREVEAAVVELGNRFCTRFVATDPWQAQGMMESLTAQGFTVEAVHPTPQNQIKQAAGLLAAIQDGTLRIYNDPLLLEDLHNVRVVERSYGSRLELGENANGHSDRLAALVTILPYALEALGSGPCEGAGPGTVAFEPGLPSIEIPDVVTSHDLHRLLRMRDEYEARKNALLGGF